MKNSIIIFVFIATISSSCNFLCKSYKGIIITKDITTIEELIEVFENVYLQMGYKEFRRGDYPMKSLNWEASGDNLVIIKDTYNNPNTIEEDYHYFNIKIFYFDTKEGKNHFIETVSRGDKYEINDTILISYEKGHHFSFSKCELYRNYYIFKRVMENVKID